MGDPLRARRLVPDGLIDLVAEQSRETVTVPQPGVATDPARRALDDDVEAVAWLRHVLDADEGAFRQLQVPPRDGEAVTVGGVAIARERIGRGVLVADDGPVDVTGERARLVADLPEAGVRRENSEPHAGIARGDDVAARFQRPVLVVADDQQTPVRQQGGG
ncbi:MAG TPA: hypothetical protein VGL09_20760 [Methylomirabilota bacterium]